MDKADVVIIGAGFAGASTAWHLSENHISNVLILEREDLPGLHASGQNASMMRQFEEDPVIARCTFKGGGFLLAPPYHWEKILRQTGSLMLFGKSHLEKISKTMGYSLKMGLEVEIVSRKEAARRVDILADADFDQAVWTVTDGVLDINTLLWAYLSDAKKKGVRMAVKQPVLGIEKTKKGFFRITTESAIIEAKCVVNAAGAWAADIGQMAGATDIKLTPCRRHLYNTSPMGSVDPDWPFVWDIDNKYYFRPESGGLLLSPCDEEPMPAGVPSTSHVVRELLAEKLERFCPRLANIVIGAEWAGLRTFADDRRFVIGEDPKIPGFYWSAGLGGFGVTTSYVVGKFTADAILNGGANTPEEFKPARF